ARGQEVRRRRVQDQQRAGGGRTGAQPAKERGELLRTVRHRKEVRQAVHDQDAGGVARGQRGDNLDRFPGRGGTSEQQGVELEATVGGILGGKGSAEIEIARAIALSLSLGDNRQRQGGCTSRRSADKLGQRAAGDAAIWQCAVQCDETGRD